MRVLAQRVTEARVEVAGVTVAEIGPGLLLFAGIASGDGAGEVDLLTRKIAHLRIFDDSAGELNRSALDLLAADEPVELLLVSQFTLYADCRKGRRPSFGAAAPAIVAAPLIEALANGLRGFGLRVALGRFGAEMQVALINDGPVTIWLDSSEL